MTPDTDILADLAAIPSRPPGNPCGIAVMRSKRPDLIPHWDRVLEAKRTGQTRASDKDIAAWFVAHGYDLDSQIIQRHRTITCRWCASGHAA